MDVARRRYERMLARGGGGRIARLCDMCPAAASERCAFWGPNRHAGFSLYGYKSMAVNPSEHWYEAHAQRMLDVSSWTYSDHLHKIRSSSWLILTRIYLPFPLRDPLQLGCAPALSIDAPCALIVVTPFPSLLSCRSVPSFLYIFSSLYSHTCALFAFTPSGSPRHGPLPPIPSIICTLPP
jgi:hypothetical protein